MFHLLLAGELVGGEEKKLGKGRKPLRASSVERRWNVDREASSPRPAPKE